MLRARAPQKALYSAADTQFPFNSFEGTNWMCWCSVKYLLNTQDFEAAILHGVDEIEGIIKQRLLLYNFEQTHNHCHDITTQLDVRQKNIAHATYTENIQELRGLCSHCVKGSVSRPGIPCRQYLGALHSVRNITQRMKSLSTSFTADIL
jgi:hypothetical protein